MVEKVENPYQSPTAALAESGMAAPPRFKLWAAVVGTIVDIGTSTVLGIVLGAICGFLYYRPGVTPEQLQLQFSESMAFWAAASFVGYFGTFVGGYVAAWLGRCFPLRHALATGILSLSLGVVVLVAFPQPGDMVVKVLSSAITIPVALLGGYVRKRVTERAP